MRKVFYTLIAILFCFNTIAQEKHLTFKGIPIDGNIHTFANKLKQQGFIEVYKEDNNYILEGDFSYLTNCKIYLYSNPSNANIYMVAVTSAKFYNWSSLINKYNKIIVGLKEKYGETIFYNEIFNGKDIKEIDEATKWNMLLNNQVEYNHRFLTENGEIYIRLDYEGKLVIYYNDNINNHANEIRKKNDL